MLFDKRSQKKKKKSPSEFPFGFLIKSNYLIAFRQIWISVDPWAQEMKFLLCFGTYFHSIFPFPADCEASHQV